MRSGNVGRVRVLAVVAVLLSGAVACVAAAPRPEPLGASGETTEADASGRTAAGPLNVLLITVDDMGWDSLGITGSPIPNITPNIDRLAAAGVLFTQAHVTIAICQPTRAVWMTGRYPHRNGALGFGPIDPDVPTLVEALGEAGYQTGLMAKTGHVVPSRLTAFDAVIGAKELQNGRSPDLYYEHAAEFFRQAKNAEQPFFLMANSQDPHRPFAASRQEVNFRARDATSTSEQYGGGFPDARLAFSPEQIPVPGYLIDLPDVRLEVAQYYTSVRRADATVGAVLRALDDSGMADRTLVMFLSDHGPSFPFAKANAWMHSTRTPWIVRWPGVIAAARTDADLGGRLGADDSRRRRPRKPGRSRRSLVRTGAPGRDTSGPRGRLHTDQFAFERPALSDAGRGRQTIRLHLQRLGRRRDFLSLRGERWSHVSGDAGGGGSGPSGGGAGRPLPVSFPRRALRLPA